MSTNQYLYGSYVIPSKEWAGFKKKVVSAWNAKRDALQEAGNAVYAEFKGRSAQTVLNKHEDDVIRLTHDFNRKYAQIGRYCANDFLSITSKQIPNSKIIKPTKELVDGYMLKAGNTTTTFEECHAEFTISFNNKTRTVSINIEENNRNVERFFQMEDAFVTAFFRALNSVTWARNTGGELTTVSESCNDDEDADRYDKDFSHGYGPIHESERVTRNKILELKIRQYRR